MLAKFKKTGQVLNVPDSFYQANQQLYEPVTANQQTQPQVQPVQNQVQEQPQNLGQSIGSGAVSLLGNILSPFIKTGKDIGGASFEAGRANQIGQIGNQSNNLIQQQEALNKQLMLEKDPQRKQQLLEQSRKIGSGLSGLTQTADLATNIKNPFLNSPEIQKVLENPALEAGKNAAGVLSWAVPFGQGGNILTRALAPGLVAGGLQDFSTRGKADTELLGNALLGAGGAGALYGLGKIPGLIKGLGAGAENAGEKLIQSQYNLPRSSANALKLNQTVQDLADYGLTNIDDVQKAASVVTGKDGIVTKITQDAIAKAKPVQTSGLLEVASNIANDPSIPPGQDEKLVAFLKKGIQSLTNSGTLADNFSANPTDTFTFIQDLEKKAASITKGRLPNMIPAQDQALSQAYKSFADELRTRLFEGAGADSQVVNVAKNPQLLETLKKISPALADKISSAKTVGELRSVAAPFVRGSIAAGVTESGANMATQNIGGVAKGVGQLVQNPLNLLAIPLSSNTVNAGVGGALRGAGQTLQNVGGVNVSPLLQQILFQGASRIGSMGGGIQPTDNTQNNANTGANAPENNIQSQDTQGNIDHTFNLPQTTENSNKDMARKAIQLAMIQDLKTGGKHITDIQAISKALNLDQDTSQSDIGKLSAKDAALVRSGKQSLNEAKNMIAKDPSLLAKSLIPGRPISRSYDAATYNATDSILRLRTGAVARDDEIRAYQQRLFPWIGDDANTIAFKTKQLENIFANYNIQ